MVLGYMELAVALDAEEQGTMSGEEKGMGSQAKKSLRSACGTRPSFLTPDVGQ